MKVPFLNCKLLLSLVLFGMPVLPVLSQNFNRVYGGNGTDNFRAVVAVPGSTDFIVSGATTSAGAGNSDVYVARITETGTVVWQNAYGAAGYEVGLYSLINTNGNIVIGGITRSYLAGGLDDILLLEIDPNGALQWAQVLGTAGLNESITRIKLSTNGMVIIANSSAAGSNTPDFLALEVTSNGGVINWSNLLDSGSGDISASIIESNLGGYFLIGGSNTSLYDQAIIRLNAAGALVGAIHFGNADNENAAELIELPNNDLMVMGNFRQVSGTGLEISLTTVRQDLTLQGSVLFGDNGVGDERAFDLLQMPDGGYVISGYTSGFGQGSQDVYLVRTDVNRNLVWARSYGNTTSNQGFGIVRNSIGGVMVTGLTVSGSMAGQNALLLSTDANGDVPGTCMTPDVISTISNPVPVNLNLTPSNPNLGNLTVTPVTTSIGLLDEAFTCGTLPITIAKINLTNVNGAIDINWITSSEINNNYFVIERSSDGLHFNPIGEVKGAGSSSVLLNYNFIDTNPLAGTNYYRLKQVDFDGTSGYSGIYTINLDEENLQVFPNPSNGIFKIVSKHLDISELKIVNAVGQEVSASIELNEETGFIDLSNQPNGIYFLKISSSLQTKTVKLIKF
jgi:hypothetical protein